MTIDTAIEILDIHQADMLHTEVPDLIDAMKLGIAGLKRIQRLRDYSMTTVDTWLQGETSR